MCRHTQQSDILFLTVGVTCFKGIFLLIETKRTVTTQLYANDAVISFGLHMGRHFFRGIQLCLSSYSDNGQVGSEFVHLSVFYLRGHIAKPLHIRIKASELRTCIHRHDKECQQKKIKRQIAFRVINLSHI